MNHNRFPLSVQKTVLAAALTSLTVPAISQDLVLEEVTVTATKRETTVQEIAATVNVVTGESLEKFNTFDFVEVSEQTAGLTLASPNARNSSIALRGVGTDPEAGTASTVDVYWNDVAVRQDVVFNQLYDLERMEVLRGPQGVLQGRSSPAGAINVVTRKPDLSAADGMVQLSASDNDGINGQFAYGGPIIKDVFAVRIAGVYDTNFANNVENLTSGLDDPENETKSARLTGIWQISDNLSAELTYQYLDRDTDDNKAISGTDGLSERPTLEPSDMKALGKYDNFGNFESDLVSLEINWGLEDHEVVFLYGYNDSEKLSGTENDRANYITEPLAPTHQNAFTEAESDTFEIRFASTDRDFWDYMVGVYYLDQDTQTSFNANTVVAGGISFFSEGDIPVGAEDWAVFTFNSFYLSDRWQLDVGLRYTEFERTRSADVFYGDVNFIPESLQDFAGQIVDGISAAFPINAVSPENQKTEEDAVTGTISLRYDWTDSTSLYASYSQGYRPGGISIVPDPDVQFLPNGEADLLHDEEDSDSIEFGFKSRFADGRATLNGAIFYQEFDGYLGFARGVQVLDDSGNPVDIAGGLIYNGDATVWGTELEGRVLLTEQWSLGGALSYAKGEWDGAEAPCNEREPGEVLGRCDVDGEAIGAEPEWSASINTEYFIPLDDTEIYFRGLWSYTGERDNIDASAGIGPVTDEFDAYDLLNLYAGWRSSDYRWDVSVWGKNVLDSDEITRQTSSDQYDIVATGGSYTSENLLAERVIGLTARYNFF